MCFMFSSIVVVHLAWATMPFGCQRNPGGMSGRSKSARVGPICTPINAAGKSFESPNLADASNTLDASSVLGRGGLKMKKPPNIEGFHELVCAGLRGLVLQDVVNRARVPLTA